jgi:hypothetical protein
MAKRKRTIVPTPNQKKVAKLIIETSAKGKKILGNKILADAGYSKAIQKNPGDILKSKGVKQELKLLGFDVNSAKKVCAAILNHGQEANKVAVAKEIFKVYGVYAPEKQEHTVTGIEIIKYGSKK